MAREEFLAGPERFLGRDGMNWQRRYAVRKVDDKVVQQAHEQSPYNHP